MFKINLKQLEGQGLDVIIVTVGCLFTQKSPRISSGAFLHSYYMLFATSKIIIIVKR